MNSNPFIPTVNLRNLRIEKILKRSGKSDTILIIEDVCLDIEKRIITKAGYAISLTPMEFDLLCILAKNKNIALKRETLLSEIWGVTFEGESRTVDVHVAALRRKTGLKIISVPKIGYRLEADEA